MTVPILNPIGLQSQLFEASVQASVLRGAPIVAGEAPVMGLTRWVAHALNEAIRRVAMVAMRMPVMEVMSVPNSVAYRRTILAICSRHRGRDVERAECAASKRWRFMARDRLVPPAGLEPTAPGLGILCSIHLS